MDNRAKLIKILRANRDLLRGADFSATQFLRLVDALLDSGVTVQDDAEKERDNSKALKGCDVKSEPKDPGQGVRLLWEGIPNGREVGKL